MKKAVAEVRRGRSRAVDTTTRAVEGCRRPKRLDEGQAITVEGHIAVTKSVEGPLSDGEACRSQIDP